MSVRIRRDDDDLGCAVLRGVAYRAVCDACKWRGPSRRLHNDARRDKLEHNAAGHQQ